MMPNMIDDLEQLLRQHADAGSDDPMLGWEISVNPIAVHIKATAAQTYGTEQQAFTAAVQLSNRLAGVDGLEPSQHAAEELTAEGNEGGQWRGRVRVSLVRA